MNKTIGLVIGAVLIAGAAFAGGYFLSTQLSGAPLGVLAGAPAGAPGAFAQLTDAERQQLGSMSETEREAFFEEKGIDMPTGGPGGSAGQGAPGVARGAGPNLLEGTVSGVTEEKITVTLAAGGSANIYVDDSTVVAATEGKTPTVVDGASVIVFTEPEAAGVSAAKAVVIK